MTCFAVDEDEGKSEAFRDLLGSTLIIRFDHVITSREVTARALGLRNIIRKGGETLPFAQRRR